MINKKKLLDYQEELQKELQDPELAIAYLNETLKDEDPRLFLHALKNVLEAQSKDIATLAQKADLNREHLYRMLSLKGNPRLTSIVSVLNALGWELAVQPSEN